VRGSVSATALLGPDRLERAGAQLRVGQPVRRDGTGRLFPGEGELPLHELVDAMPAGSPLSVESPVAALARQPARLAFAATTRFLDQHERPASAAPDQQ
jgi:hypothetical protein